MGTWGVGIQADDLVADVTEAFDDCLKKGGSLAAAPAVVRRQFAETQGDPDEGPVFWLALAQAEWRYGAVEPSVLQRIRDDTSHGRGLSRWRESPSALAKREAVLQKFIAKLESPKPRPKRIPKLIIRPAKFQPGDCLSISFGNGEYGAAFVLAVDETHPEYGVNLIGRLDHKSASPPALDVFANRRWRRIAGAPWDGGVDVAWYGHVRFRLYAKRFRVVGRTPILQSDPNASPIYTGWDHLFEGAA